MCATLARRPPLLTPEQVAKVYEKLKQDSLNYQISKEECAMALSAGEFRAYGGQMIYWDCCRLLGVASHRHALILAAIKEKQRLGLNIRIGTPCVMRLNADGDQEVKEIVPCTF